MFYCCALVDTRSPTGSGCQRGDGTSAPSGELCIFTNQRGGSSDEKQGISPWASSQVGYGLISEHGSREN